jgi:hypothetical protein
VYRSEGIRLRGKRYQHFGKGNTPWDCIDHLGDDGLAGVLEEGTVVGKSIGLHWIGAEIQSDKLTYARMVTLLSLLKIRRSDLVVMLAPMTSGLRVVPDTYSVALDVSTVSKLKKDKYHEATYILLS